MRPLVIAVGMLPLLGGPAAAHCPSYPPTLSWEGTQSSAAQAVCQQQELARWTEQQAITEQLRSQQQALSARAELMLQQQRAAQMLDLY